MRRCDRQGFTLIEVLIVTAIIGVLAAIAIPQYAGYRVKTMDAAAKSALHQLAKAQEAYYLSANRYTAVKANLFHVSGWTVEPPVSVTIRGATTSAWSAAARHTSSSHTFTYDTNRGGLLTR
jgi:prepilin-type N-terminal cleavage/methylation domain-containing protein